jgi:putative phosphoesterase
MNLKIGIVSDAHGNPHGLRQCLAALEAKHVDEIMCLGDSVGYLPDATEVLDDLQSVKATSLLGNHEAMLLGILKLDEDKDEAYRLRECRKTLSSKHIDQFSRLLPFHQRTINDRRLLFVHGSPWDPLSGYIYPDSNLEQLGQLNCDAVFMGNTHVPFTSNVAGSLVVNVGSCGLPRDHGNLPSCAVYDTIPGTCEILRCQIDVEQIIGKYGKSISSLVADCLRRK